MPKTLLKLTLSLLLIFSSMQPCFAFTLNSTTLGVPEGLSQSNVSSIVEDAEGYVWVGTVNGLNRYDGKEFRHYFPSKRNELASAFIRSLYISKSGSMFIGTDKGLSIYDPMQDKITSSKNLGFDIDEAIWAIYEYGDNIFIGTENSIYIIRELNNSKLSLKNKYSGNFGVVKNITLFKEKMFIRNYSGELYSIAEGIVRITGNVNSMNIINNELLIFKNEGVYSYKDTTLTKIDPASYTSVTTDANYNLALDKNSIYNIDTIKTPISKGKLKIPEKSLDHPRIIRGRTKTFILNQNNGFLIIDDNANLAQTKEIVGGNVWSISPGDFSELVVTADASIIQVFDQNLNIIKEYNSHIEGPKSAVMIDNFIYISSSMGLTSLNTDSGKIENIFEGSFFIVKAKLDDKSIFAGSTSGTVVQYDIDSGYVQEYAVDKGNPIFDIKEHNGSLLIASQGGLFRLTNNIATPLYTKQLVISIDIYDGDILFGTGNSIQILNRLNNQVEELYNNNKPIFSIAQNQDYVLASSVNEIVVINKKDRKHFILNQTLGIQGEYNAQSILKKNDKLYIGGITGISFISIDKVIDYLKSHTPPSVALNELSIFNIPETPKGKILNNKLNKTSKIKIKYSDYPFTFTFHSPKSPLLDINYIYQMRGLSDALINSKGINSATYTNLSPGDYEFSVFAIDPISGEHGEEKILSIEITPPWWLSLPAKIIYFVFTLLISIAIIKVSLKRREIQRQIAKSEERLKLSLWGSGDEMWDWDIETGQIYRSNIWGSLEFPRDGQRSGQEGEESNIHPMDQIRVRDALNKHFYGETDHFEAAYRVKGKSNDWVWILDRAKIVERDENDNALRMTGTIKNISHFKQAEEQLRLFERAIQNISEGMFILDSEFSFVEVNEACCDLSMLSKQDFIGTLFNFDLYPDSYSEQIRSILKQQGRWSNEVESARGNGTSFLMELTVDAIYDDQGELSHYVGVFSDVSRRKQQEEELRKLTNNDLLTNLPNRSNLMVTLGNLVKRDSHHTLMVLDLDNFKKINDSLGHQVGDELLILVSERIKAAVPNHTSIYRLGGDEFAILIDKNPEISVSAVIAKNVIHAFETAFQLSAEKVVVGVSIGIVLYPEDDQNEQALLRKADIAMYHAKSGGGNRYQFYSESLNKNAIRQLEVENLIREGIKDDLFEVYYQPKVDLKSGQMAGMEALVRLNHPEHGLIPPNNFIPLAEENGLIVEIGDIVLKKACFAAQKWRSLGLFDGRVAVNLSSKQFALPDLQQRIESILRLTQLPAANLELEITEGTVIREPEKAIKVMQQLSKMGVSLALDDFGTGYSSLSYLKRFPIHTLKIDKAFVDDIDKSDRDLKMVDSIITIAHNMGLSVVGEGVEDASQLSILRALKCEEIQGYIYSKAVTESEFTTLLHNDTNSKPLKAVSIKNS
ncbi:EAL domain-containing protein [Shewanella sp. KX20019]|uniref:EAL domain-containing protein n=1 Tax=Shewanella sp. KX20019 TaxID=2803864 RepID=UPI0019268C2C|nr:EAL domain-containing protein [Shewanella sp. KX20019]QQX82573.1 EAL domain-containing protein [Shewanella sp. KX20019]